MIKFRATGNGRELIGFGLTKKNVEKLKAGRPVVVRLRDLGIPHDIDITLFYGEDERALYTLLDEAGFISSDTKITGESVLRDGLDSSKVH